MKATYVVTLMLFLLSLTAEASEWFLMGDDGRGQMYIDVTSISKHERLMKAWFRIDFKSPQTLQNHPSRPYRSMKMLDYFNCAERTSAIGQVIFYSDPKGTGEVIGSSSNPVDELQFKDMAPDTIGESELNFVCPFE